MDPSHLEVLRETLDIQRRKETFERALGRAVRKRELDFSIYVQIITEVREGAEAAGVSIESFARKILGKTD